MQPMLWGPWDVFAYESMLHTRAPLLRWLYAESHAWEPWAVHGVEVRQGEYRFPNVLYVAHEAREALLDRIFDDVLDVPGYCDAVEARFVAEGRRLLRAIRHRDVEGMLSAGPRCLSVGVFKDALDEAALLVLLGQFLPSERVRPHLPAPWQPRGLPHFLKFEVRALFAAERGDVALGLERAAHHSRFLLEDTPLHDPAAFARHLARLGRNPAALRRQRLALLRQHRAAVARADSAERAVLAELKNFGRHTATSLERVRALLRFVRFLGTAEELKHVLLVETSRALRSVIEARGLNLETTGPEDLKGEAVGSQLSAVSSGARTTGN